MNSIVLVGFMGTGKSAVAKALADRLDWPLADVDDRIVARAEKSITTIFSEDGEARFRELETAELESLAQASGSRVIATGGGIVLADRNWPLLRALGPVIALAATPEIILQRVGQAQDRPLLAGTPEEVRSRIQELLQKRSALYAKADWTCDTSQWGVTQVTDAIIAWLASQRHFSLKPKARFF